MATHHYEEGGFSQQLPLHLCLFLITLALFVTLSWYQSYESLLDGILHQIRLLVIASPLVLLLAVHWLSTGAQGRRLVPFVAALPDDPQALHRAGGSPWGVGLLLLLLLLMVSYQSCFHGRWFPLAGR
ncbi:hypothetical protein HPP92_003964 [Vanilla planifolia]|uniref:Uncharacterized protein n=1 Tax=Vanilla planifolia TaxID=51239 RepID=A0A835SGL8_VANPL|nr:hypothetical protein HPP92_004380 [Vanilla planifolia]KAG0503892.1 hypothetical protein HPP92_003964 [Vanilla planifolia]